MEPGKVQVNNFVPASPSAKNMVLRSLCNGHCTGSLLELTPRTRLQHSNCNHHHHHHHSPHQHLPVPSPQVFLNTSEEESSQTAVQSILKKSRKLYRQKKTVQFKATAGTPRNTHSDYSSDSVETDTEGSDSGNLNETKSDYSIRKSASYSAKVTTSEHHQASNMARVRMRRNYDSADSEDEEGCCHTCGKVVQFQTTHTCDQMAFNGTAAASATISNQKMQLQSNTWSSASSSSVISHLSRFISTNWIRLWMVVYNFVSRVLQFDTWMLAKMASKNKRRNILMLLLFLPLLAYLLGTYLGEEEGATVISPMSVLSPLISAISVTVSQMFTSVVETGPSVSNPAVLEMQTNSVLDEIQRAIKDLRAVEQSMQQEILKLKQENEEQKLSIDELRTHNNCCANHTAMFTELETVLLSKLFQALNDFKGDFQQWMQQNSVPKSEFEGHVQGLENRFFYVAEEAVKKVLSRSVPLQPQKSSFNSSINANTLSLEDIRKEISKAIQIYDADKTGQVDYALETSGGSVVSTRCTETHGKGPQYSMFGIPLWSISNSPRTAIQYQVHPGECWAFKGSQGYLVLQLSAVVKPTAFSMEHIPKSLSPSGNINSAPREFSVHGLNSEDNPEGKLLGKYEYKDDGEPLQFFPVADPDPGYFKYIELRIQSNHGNLEYTCLYRFRVHGVKQ